MYNEVVLAKLSTCVEHIEAIEKYFAGSEDSEHFFNLDGGVKYDATLMRLQALGENLKRIYQKHPKVISELGYPEFEMIIRFRDYVSHHYEQLEHEVIFDICLTKIPVLKKCFLQLIKSKSN